MLDRFAGYNDVLLIPAGATNIIIRESKASNNYLGNTQSNPTLGHPKRLDDGSFFWFVFFPNSTQPFAT